MKSFLAFILSLCLIFTACGSTQPQAQPITVQPALDELVDAIVEDCELPMPAILNDELMVGLLDVSVDSMVQYHGYISMSNDACDQIIAMEAKDGKSKQLAKKLDARLNFVIEDAKSGSEQKLARAQAGAVYQRENYLFLVIAGRPDADPTTETAEIINRIEDSFPK